MSSEVSYNIDDHSSLSITALFKRRLLTNQFYYQRKPFLPFLGCFRYIRRSLWNLGLDEDAKKRSKSSSWAEINLFVPNDWTLYHLKLLNTCHVCWENVDKICWSNNQWFWKWKFILWVCSCCSPKTTTSSWTFVNRRLRILSLVHTWT